MSDSDEMCHEEQIFECRQCGHCCHGETTVSLDADDLARMVKWFGLPEEEVKEKYLRVTGNVVQMKIVDGHCIFYREGCTIHPAKPWRCGQWPLHPSLLADEANFQAISSSCPGIKAELGYEVFRSKLATLLNRQQSKG